MDYKEFIERKKVTVPKRGFDVAPEAIHPLLFDWQSEVVRWALSLGKAALFQECGMGKTLEQCQWAKLVQEHTGGKVLILAPLAVAHQTVAEGAKIGLKIQYVRHQDEAVFPGVYITNYDMLKEFDGSQWDGVVLDESSVLKNFTGATKRMILEMFESVPFKLACTATPAPNDHMELGNHAEFLNIMPSNEMLQRWFINDTMKAGGYRVKGHAERDFWKWVTSWAVCMSKPSDLGYPDKCDRYSFDMPKLLLHNETVSVDHTRAWDSGQLIVDESLSATGLWREKKATLKDRCQRAREIVSDQDTWVIWCETNDEADELVRLFPEAVEVRGSESIKAKEDKLRSFSEGRARIIITKGGIAGYGLNWQHCHKHVDVSQTYSFEEQYQKFRRSWRFGQKSDVDIYLIAAESEGNILKSLQEKQAAHKQMQARMNEAMKEHGLGAQTRRERVEYKPAARMTLPEWLIEGGY